MTRLALWLALVSVPVACWLGKQSDYFEPKESHLIRRERDYGSEEQPDCRVTEADGRSREEPSLAPPRLPRAAHREAPRRKKRGAKRNGGSRRRSRKRPRGGR